MDTGLAKLETIAETSVAQLKKLKLDINNILAHVKPDKNNPPVAKTVTSLIPLVDQVLQLLQQV